jgi:hypothetical protein
MELILIIVVLLATGGGAGFYQNVTVEDTVPL